ncbi:MAG: endopeptidase La [Bacteroidales bacterium]|nr:endopeptidase La [Bacteroidales bacterium]
MEDKTKRYFTDEIDTNDDDSLSFIAEFEENQPDSLSESDFAIEETLPVLPLRNMVLFPNVFLPVAVGRPSSLQLIKEVERKNGIIAVHCQKEQNEDNPGFNDLYPIGTIGRIVKIFHIPEQAPTVIIQGIRRAELKEIVQEEPYLLGKIDPLLDRKPRKSEEQEFKAVIDSCRELTTKYIKLSQLPKEALFGLNNIDNPLHLISFISNNLPIKIEGKIELLSKDSLLERSKYLLKILTAEVQLAEIKATVQMRAREDIDKQQREYFLQQQIKAIQSELGSGSQDKEIEELREQAKKMKWPKEVGQTFEKEIQKLERTHTQSPEYSIQLNYLQTMLALPWGIYTKDNLDLKKAEQVLDKDHYGLEKVKERILEHLAVLKLKGDMKSPIICLYGPPGVGKTSLGKSIAKALNRNYIRMSLGGVHDEAEIRGHRRTYIGAMPGRIIKNLMKAKSSNPVFVLDEIDKINRDRQGDPSSALLEVLDPEQNTAFHDNYLDVDFDLSKVMFIATANNLNTIPAPLLDRMELIEVSGYITEEKIEIARRHLVPKELEANGMKKGDVRFYKPALEEIIESYTRESGVRELEKKINKVLRKIARQYATEGKTSERIIQKKDLYDLLGAPEYSKEVYQGNHHAGVVTGLAWTAVGGEILFVETSLSRSKGGKLTITGNLGDVMKESALLALEYIKAHAEMLNIDYDVFNNWSVHLHVPEGAIPKDGPSAGITMATSLASAFTQRKVKANIAMTGEITLRGKVLPVGGIKEKILAAKRAGIKEIILSSENKKNIDEIQDIYLKGLTFHYVNNVKEVFDLAITDEKVENPIDFTTPEKTDK